MRLEETTVPEARQAVVIGEIANLILHELALRDVLDRTLHTDDPVLRGDSLALGVEHPLRTVDLDGPVIQTEGGAAAQTEMQCGGEALAAVGVDPLEQQIPGDGRLAGCEAVDAMELVGSADLELAGLDAPAGQVGEPLSTREPRFAFSKLPEDGLHAVDHQVEGPGHVADLIPAIDAEPVSVLAPADGLDRVLDLSDRPHQSTRGQKARSEGERQRERTGGQELLPGIGERSPLRLEAALDPQLQRPELAGHLDQIRVPARAGHGEVDARATQSRPTGGGRVADQLCGDQAPEPFVPGVEGRGHDCEGLPVAGHDQRLFAVGHVPTDLLDHHAGEILGASHRIHAILAIHEQQQRGALVDRQLVGVVEERRRMVQLEVRAELGRP